MQLNLCLSLLVVIVVMALLAERLRSRMHGAGDRFRHVLGIGFGGSAGVAIGLLVAIALNPLVGLQRGTFFNLAIFAMCLGFLGLIVGSLCGLIYAGMIQASQSRNTSSSEEVAS